MDVSTGTSAFEHSKTYLLNSVIMPLNRLMLHQMGPCYAAKLTGNEESLSQWCIAMNIADHINAAVK